MNKTFVNFVKLLALFLSSACTSAVSSGTISDANSVDYQHMQLSMFIWSNQLAPIISHESPNILRGPISDYQGIIVEVLNSLPDHLRPNIEVVLNSRKRGERDLYAGLVDMSILSSRWLKQPEKLIFSLPVYTHREYLYATSPIANKELKELVTNRRICIRRGFKFPNIDPLFDEGRTTRVENKEEAMLFNLLMRDRCDFLLTNEFVANAIIKSNQLQDDIYKSAFTIDEVGFTIAFHPKHKAFVKLLNEHIRELENTGKLDSIIEAHTVLH